MRASTDEGGAVENPIWFVPLQQPQHPSPASAKWHTSSSTHGPSPRTWRGRSCIHGRSRGRAGRQGSGPSTSSRSTAALCDVSMARARQIVQQKFKHTFRHCQRGAPLVSENVEADAAVGVDVGVIDSGGEVDLGRLEGVVGREVNSEEEDAPSIWRFRLQQICQPRFAACMFGCHAAALDSWPHTCARGKGGIVVLLVKKVGDDSKLTGPMIVACQWN